MRREIHHTTGPTAIAIAMWHACGWVVAVVVPVAIGGIVGGSLGGLCTAAILIPWFSYRLRHRPARRTESPRPVRSIPVIQRRSSDDESNWRQTFVA